MVGRSAGTGACLFTARSIQPCSAVATWRHRGEAGSPSNNFPFATLTSWTSLGTSFTEATETPVPFWVDCQNPYHLQTRRSDTRRQALLFSSAEDGGCRHGDSFKDLKEAAVPSPQHLTEPGHHPAKGSLLDSASSSKNSM